MNHFHDRTVSQVPRWCKEWVNLAWMLYGWWAREHQLNLQALGLSSGTSDAEQLRRAVQRWQSQGLRALPIVEGNGLRKSPTQRQRQAR
jgi:hypothetical protein